jgi:glycosyltransferase involved in cell wall biosynthesis
MRVLLLSAYDAASHKYWRETLCREISDWDWQVLTLPPRHFSWRIRSNALTWWGEQGELLQQNYDVVLATSMVDLATLRGLVPSLSRVPTVLYFHENQFEYPAGQSQHGLLEAQMVTLYSALAADRLVFNSAYNQDSFLAGCKQMLQRFPDGVPAATGELLQEKTEVLPVPITAPIPGDKQRSGSKLQLVWNHRWEYDKGPAELLALATALVDSALEFDLHVVGQQFRKQPAEFDQLQQLLQSAGSLGHWGYLESSTAYQQLLASCDVVVSTALHDFQGLAVLEACAAGCKPLVPARLVYPEWFGAANCYQNIDHAVASLCSKDLSSVDVSRFSVGRLIPRYRELIHSLSVSNSVS